MGDLVLRTSGADGWNAVAPVHGVYRNCCDLVRWAWHDRDSVEDVEERVRFRQSQLRVLHRCSVLLGHLDSVVDRNGRRDTMHR
jgi:hypothetical protein